MGRDAAEIKNWIFGGGIVDYGKREIRRALEHNHGFCESAGSLCQFGDLGVTLRNLPSPREVRVEFGYNTRVSVNLKGIRIDLTTGVYYPVR